jgi:molybdopterin-guanine dinucleotide biosynthesis protein A
MGQDKALLQIDGKTLLERAIAAVRPLAREIVIVADVADKYALPGCRVVGDKFPDAGPVGGIVTGLLTLDSGWHFVLACDMPFLQPSLLLLLLQQASEQHDAVIPFLNGRAEPLCALYRHTAAPKLQSFLEQGGRAAHRALELLEIRRLDETLLRRADPDLASFINVNTLQEYDRILK